MPRFIVDTKTYRVQDNICEVTSKAFDCFTHQYAMTGGPCHVIVL